MDTCTQIQGIVRKCNTAVTNYGISWYVQTEREKEGIALFFLYR